MSYPISIRGNAEREDIFNNLIANIPDYRDSYAIAVAQLAVQIAQSDELVSILDGSPLVSTNPSTGRMFSNPAFNLLRNVERSIAAGLAKFGLTSLDYKTLTKGEEPEADEGLLDDLNSI
ncbi:hypothetical protein HK22_02075 [Gluconobacter sp. DsW_056]|uniref:hypothetical protein n=1 Tax=Gluconobacter sp. DsW_056 TaxID=1511209 RepID=UPI000A389403|nr:hypothetical protein [Gluconobacter sp. DsW_056]OUI81667.1 hypothetical protein HK22_02075 [Gluconobacter sp. DsW_056]